ncbi:MAG: prepilin-type N-terminal cleavage/methylation domain-containing protein [Bacteroidales bacterium]|jgi:prepilin-type N-terminal cleavage/methylation domain-containing protein|nr:prepilin-type N-terminal cleavage/methylation domain-containing protein [Bacteroidales bacterium]
MIIKNKNKSFTLIELLVVIVIIGILAGVIMISTSSSIDKANLAKAQAFSSTVQNELLSNLISEWTFDNASNIGEDTWGNKDIIIYGNTFYEKDDCFSQGCLSFSTMDDHATSSLVYNNLHSFTLTAWINPVSIEGYIKPIIGTLLGNNGRSMLALSGYKIKFHDYDKGILSDNDIIKLNQWQFVVVAYDNSDVKLYYNGLQAGRGVYTKIDSNDITIIGRVKNVSTEFNRCFEGKIDDIRIYNAALSSSQIKQNYIAGLNSMLTNGNISKEDYNERINQLAYEE